uniref:Nucleolar protein 4 n=1 Tax=Kwoniella dejecticola CBS 10117 TaxID=1296121 RepID=A0A1A6ADJ2_9TREE|nr:nucleolar protein 4 [Kwoniella dejecticola CBS 10117]OBR88109.1 nucleolar protein 4 [Kwoniella dejecticola CBS 10117]
MAEEDFIPLTAGSSSKKERKERVNTTVFVSSLPYTATTTDLLTHFSYLGPVRHGFVATDKDTGKSKGVGYVTYSLKEDADRAVAELNGSTFGGGNRKIRVAVAGERASLKDRKALANDPELRPKPQPRIAAGEDKPVGDPNAIRTLVLSGLPEGITKNVLWKKVRKVDDKAELVYPVPAEEGESASQEIANIIFPSHGEALKALPKLHGHTYKGALLSCVLKKRLEKLSARGEGKNQSHAGRLIIRNLAWDTTIQDLRAAFLPYGPIHSIDLPTLPSKLPPSSDPSKPPPPPRARGFAFVWFLTRKDAEKAIEGVNGKVLKTKSGKEGREVAVDFALSKEKWEEANKKPDEEQKADGSESESDSGSDEESESGDDEDGSGSEEEEASGSEEEEDDREEDEDMSEAGSDEDEEEDEPVKPTLPSVDVGSTLFIRNLPFEVTEQELNALFRTFGPLRYARITIDKITGRSRGTGFVCFWKTEHADEAILEAEKVARETGANAMPVSKNPFALPSVLTADPSSSLASRLVLHGRTLEVSRAVTREQAGLMKEDSERARNAGDKRNTYLMREGVIFHNSPAAASLPEAEVEKRQASFNARKTLLRSNPSLYISKTRLSIRQLPLFATDRTLKRLAIYAVREFDAEVAKEEREGLARTEEMDDTLSAALEARKSSKKKGKERETAVIQSKIVRQTEKVDPLTALGRSKGYGFLEMRSHKDALKVLRFANNNVAVGGLMWTWWKEELKDLKDKLETQLKNRKNGKSAGGAGDGKETVEELENRLKRVVQRLGEGDDRSEGGMRGGKTLLIEFSIENVQVVRRRVEKIVSHREDAREERGGAASRNGKREFGVGEKRKSGVIAAEDSDDEGQSGTPNAKKAKFDKGKDKKNARRGERGGRDKRAKREDARSDSQTTSRAQAGKEGAPEEKKGIEKLGNHLGSLIGRKRKQRSGRK